MPPPLVDWQVSFTSNAPKSVLQPGSEKKLSFPAVQLALAWQVHALHDNCALSPIKLRVPQSGGHGTSPSRATHAEKPAGTLPLQTSSRHALGTSQVRTSVEVSLLASTTGEALQVTTAGSGMAEK
jgi:hypothetical protein